MRVKVRIMGRPEIPAGEQELTLDGRTLADLRAHVVGLHPDVLSLDHVLLGFINGKAVAGNWEQAILNDGDAVMLVVPISGG